MGLKFHIQIRVFFAASLLHAAAHASMPGKPVQGYQNICQDEKYDAWIKNTAGEWKLLKIKSDGTVRLEDNSEFAPGAMRELLMGYFDSKHLSEMYGERHEFVLKAVKKYAKEIAQWDAEDAKKAQDAKNAAENARRDAELASAPQTSPGAVNVNAPGASHSGATAGGGSPQMHATAPQGSFNNNPNLPNFGPTLLDCNEGNYSQADIARYENQNYGPVAGNAPREHFTNATQRLFQNLGKGTGKMVVAYYGPRQPDLENVIATWPNPIARKLVEVRNYDVGTPEYAHKQSLEGLGDNIALNAVILDARGLKVTRYTKGFNPPGMGSVLSKIVRSVLQDKEIGLLHRYRCALQVMQQAQAGNQMTSVGPRSLQSSMPAGQSAHGMHPLPNSGGNRKSSGHAGIPAGMLEKCAACHQNQASRYTQLQSLMTPESIKMAMDSGLVTADTIDRMVQKMPGVSEADHQALRDYAIEHSAAAINQRVSYTARQPRAFISQSDMGSIPNLVGVEGEALRSILPGATFYNQQDAPPLSVHQSTYTGQEGKVYGKLLISNTDVAGVFASKDPSGGSANRDIPWRNPGGMDFVKNAGHRSNFFVPPASGSMIDSVRLDRDTGKTQWVPTGPGRRTLQNILDPVVTHHIGGESSMQSYMHASKVNAGTATGEILTVRSPSGKDFTFEIRTRSMTPQGWVYDVFRPFADSDELVAAVKAKYQGKWAGNPVVQNFLRAYENPNALLTTSDVRATYASESVRINSEKEKLGVGQLDGSEFHSPVAITETLPPLPPELVEELLTETPFKSVFGKPWLKTAQGEGWAPIVKGFGIVPEGYTGHHIPMTAQGCTNCHNGASRLARQFNPPSGRMGRLNLPESDGARDWYDSVRGTMQQPVAGTDLTAGWISAPIFDPRAPVVGDPVFREQEIRANPALEKGGLIRWDFTNGKR